MVIIIDGSITYETPEGSKTVEQDEIVYDKTTDHWWFVAEGQELTRIPRERVYLITGTKGSATKELDSKESGRETDEYGHPV
ncbi:hypothetical protein K0C01_10695 [Salinarchaeum sp. IM2453]|uniref:hypothetical protein n=1 Tax=Salinarchaeum sp. IM2453 TaxID=2862870 RepID=UPI001C82B43D|nr:hypothetical protein [Salinarchaeum sp. IM2453]QZA88243.1 hypothetical protein K0C01_10695 [Salinarchaeum sp. IM2453]